MSDKENDLGYLNEVTPEDVRGLFFLDFFHKEEVRWVRNPYVTLRDISIQLATIDPDHVKNLRVQSFEDLINPVNDSGFTEDECYAMEVEFVPVCQKVEWVFDKRYRITKEILSHYKEEDGSFSCEMGQGLYVSPKTGLLIADLSTISSPFLGSEGATENPDTTYYLFDLSCHRPQIKQGMETLSERCRHMTDNQTLTSKLLEHALDEFCDYPDGSPVMSAIEDLDEFVSRSRDKSAA
ncbi:hypothetical protein OAW26_02490 [Luminiphilus sp.]|nr:hypothetical protein [Luminiphilus sp.]